MEKRGQLELTDTTLEVLDDIIEKYNKSPRQVVFIKVTGRLSVDQMLAAENELRSRIPGAQVTVGGTSPDSTKCIIDTRTRPDDDGAAPAA